VPKDDNPYRAPKAKAPRRATPTRPTVDYADSTTRARVTATLLGASLIFAGGARLIEVLYIDDFVTRTVPQGVAVFYQLLLTLSQLTRVPGIIAYLFWVYRVAKNAHGLSGLKLWVSPGWAVGYHLVPIVQLWMPYKIISFLGERSGVHLRNIQSWWAAMIGAVVVTILLSAVGRDDVRYLIVRLLLANVLFTVALWYLWRIMKDFQAAQLAHHERDEQRRSI
jgi:hypothetical protein